jgi:hypothetical protein
LENNYTEGTNHVPATVVAAYELLTWIKLPQKNQRNQPNHQGGIGNNPTLKENEDTEVHGVVFVNKNGKQMAMRCHYLHVEEIIARVTQNAQSLK